MVVNITLTLPEKIIERIDKGRGDVNRSKFVLRLLERGYLNHVDELTENVEGQEE